MSDQIGGHTYTYTSNSVILPLAIAGRPAGPDQLFSGLHCQHLYDLQLAFKHFPTKMGRILSHISATLTIAWEQTLLWQVTN